MVTDLRGMDTMTWVQILDKAVFNSHRANTLGKDMYPLTMCK